jgi:fucose permease
MTLIAKPHRGLFISLFAAFTLFGTSMTIFGAALPKILRDFAWSDGTVGAVIAAAAAGYFLSSLASSMVLRRLGPKATILCGLAACIAGLAFFASGPSFLANLLLNALIGVGQGLIEPTVSWSALKMDQDGGGKPMNLMHGAFAVGAVAGPLALGLIMAGGLAWTILFRVIAALFGLIALALAAMPFSVLGSTHAPAEAREPGARRAAPAAKRGAAYWLGFVCLMLYVGTELGISNWIAEYFVRIFSANEALASLTVSLFWIGLLAGRFGVPALYRGKRQEIVLAASSMLLVAATVSLCAIGFAARAPGASLWLPAAFTFLAGLGCSIIYPTVVSLVGVSCKDAQAEAIAFAIAGGGVGLFAFPFLMSWISQAFEIRIGFASYALIAALTAIACVALARAFAKERKNN